MSVVGDDDRHDSRRLLEREIAELRAENAQLRKDIEFLQPAPRPNLDVIVLGARTEERQALQDEFEKVVDEAATEALIRSVRRMGVVIPVMSIPKIGSLSEGEPPNIAVGFVECAEMGNVAAAIHTAVRALAQNPTLMVFAGIAGSLDATSYRIGDVILPRRIKFRPFHKFKTVDSKTHPREEEISAINGRLFGEVREAPIDPLVQQMMTHINKNALGAELKDEEVPQEWLAQYNIPKRAPKVLTEEEAFSWDKVLSNSGYVTYLRGVMHNAATTVDMESFGFLRALDQCTKSQDLAVTTRGMVVRAVSDFAEFKELSRGDERWRNLGLQNMAIATRFVVQHAFARVF